MTIVGTAHLTTYASPPEERSMLCFWEEDHGNYQHLAHLDRLVASLAGRGLPGLQELEGSWSSCPLGLYRDNGKGHGNYLLWFIGASIGIMEKKMETAMLYWGYPGIAFS